MDLINTPAIPFNPPDDGDVVLGIVQIYFKRCVTWIFGRYKQFARYTLHTFDKEVITEPPTSENVSFLAFKARNYGGYYAAH